MSDFINSYFDETVSIINMINQNDLSKIADGLLSVRENKGRLFLIGVGGSAATASHAVNDFRKICKIECYTPTDNVAELSARTNDEGWETTFVEWLKISNLSNKDAVFVLSVGGGNAEKNISMNIVNALYFAKSIQAKIFGIVGKDGGYTKKVADACVIIPPLNSDRITPHTEGLCGVLLHALVSHPSMKLEQTKWESTK